MHAQTHTKEMSWRGEKLTPLLLAVVILQSGLFYYWITQMRTQNAQADMAAGEANSKLIQLEAGIHELITKFAELSAQGKKSASSTEVQTQGKELDKVKTLHTQDVAALKKEIEVLKNELKAAPKSSNVSAPSGAPVAATVATPPATNLEAVYDHERLNNFLSMKNVPADVRNWFTYSETEAAELEKLPADSPRVIEHIRKYKLLPIPHDYLRKKHPVKDYSRGNGPHLLHIFQNKSDGFFIECGAFDGMWLSNTMLLEGLLNWTGVMIEAEPNSFEETVQKTRKVHLVPGCLSITDKPMLVNFTFGRHVYAKIVQNEVVPESLPVQCYPIYSILLALNRTTVDFFSLDIEGNELDVLKTIPFDKVDIKVLVVEFKFIKGGKEALAKFMESKGYVIYPSVPEERTFQKWAEDDYIFIKKGSGYKDTRP